MRTKDRIKATGEVFTPPELVEQMLDEIPLEKYTNPTSTFLDNSFGEGAFLLALKRRLCRYHEEEHVLNHMLFGVELMPDNHWVTCERLGVSAQHPHFVCADALSYHYRFDAPTGRELSEAPPPEGVEALFAGAEPQAPPPPTGLEALWA